MLVATIFHTTNGPVVRVHGKGALKHWLERASYFVGHDVNDNPTEPHYPVPATLPVLGWRACDPMEEGYCRVNLWCGIDRYCFRANKKD